MVSSWLGILAVACRRENGKEPVFSNTSYTRPSRGFECTQSERQIFQQVTLNRDFFVGLMRLLPHSHSCIENVNCPASRELWDFFFFSQVRYQSQALILDRLFYFFLLHSRLHLDFISFSVNVSVGLWQILNLYFFFKPLFPQDLDGLEEYWTPIL